MSARDPELRISSALLELLYIRERWGLAVGPTDAPRLLSAPPPRRPSQDRAALEHEWRREWQRALDTLGSGRSPAPWARLEDLDRDERLMLERWIIKAYRFYAQIRSVYTVDVVTWPDPGAWVPGGYVVVYLIPVDGEFSRRIGDDVLLATCSMATQRLEGDASASACSMSMP